MTTIFSLEARFWSHVWRCMHKHPCQRCCWPWLRHDGLYHFSEGHANFAHPSLPYSPMPAHRVAHFLTKGMALLPMRKLYICHQCDYKPCCNPSHHRPGSASDNARAVGARGQSKRPAVRLPDGRILTYTQRTLQGPCRPFHLRPHARVCPVEFCVYANDYEGLRGYPLTDAFLRGHAGYLIGSKESGHYYHELAIFHKHIVAKLLLLSA